MKKILILMLLILFNIENSFSIVNQYNILVLFTYHQDIPWLQSFKTGINTFKSENNNFNTTIYYESMYSAYLGNTLSQSDWDSYLSKKYKDIKLNGVIAESQNAAMYLNNSSIFSNIPKAIFSETNIEKKPDTLYLTADINDAVDQTIEMAIAQNPDATNFYIIDGKRYDSTVDKIKKLLESKDKRVDIITISSLDSLLTNVNKISSRSVIFYTLVFEDEQGNNYIPKDVLRIITDVSRAPIYTFWSSLLDSGTIGGVMLDSERVSYELLRGIKDYNILGYFQRDYSIIQGIVDWEVKKKYSLNINKKDSNFKFINIKKSVFQVYTIEILATIAILIGIFLIISLIWLKQLKVAHYELKAANIEIEKAKVVAEKLSRHDELTGLLNRRAVKPIINYEIKRKKRVEIPVTLLLLDIDHFKKVNDTYGHEMGDKVLKTIAQVISENLRETDTVARWGGEEFMILTPVTTSQQAYELAQNIRLEIMTHIFKNCNQITVSIGISELEKDEDFKVWFERTDQALYLAKNSGRNCVKIN